jgi:cytochrome c biogenesis protein CcdA
MMRIGAALVFVAVGMTLRFAVAGLDVSGVLLMIVGGLILITEGTVIATRRRPEPGAREPAGWPVMPTYVEPPARRF